MEKIVQEPSVAIILVNWNGLAYSQACLESLSKLSYQNVEVVLVDNGSESSDVDALKEMDLDHLILNEQNLGFTGGNNVGIKYALDNSFELIMLLNNDTEVSPDFLEPLIEEAIKTNVAAVQPKIYQMHTNRIWSLGGTFNRVLGKPLTLKVDNSFENAIDWLTGCCFMAKRSVFESVGLLDDRFFALCEDVDWSLRAKKLDYELRIVPNSIIYHHESASDRSRTKTKEGFRSPFRQYLNVRNHLFLVRKHVPRRFKLIAYVYYTFRAAVFSIYYLTRGRFKKLMMTWKGYWDGLNSSIK